MNASSTGPDEGLWLIVLAASAGGIAALKTVLSSLPVSLPGAVAVVLHRPKRPESILAQILARTCALPVTTARFGESIRPGRVYLARPDFHLTVQASRRFGYVDGRRVRGVLSSANPLLESAAEVFKDHVVGVVLTGSGMDATDGVRCVKAQGGIVIVQDPRTAQYPSMPSSALTTGVVDRVLPVEAIAAALVEITGAAAANGERAM
jgi:two-component system chemotaxis response regulator CheB